MGGVRQWPAPDSVASGGASMQSQNRNPKRFLKKQDLIKSGLLVAAAVFTCSAHAQDDSRSEEHTSELQSLMRISYAVFCLKKKNKQIDNSKLQSLTEREQ